MKTKLPRVLAWPEKYNRGDNPYNFLLYRAIRKFGAPVSEYRPLRSLKFWSYDVLHLHWPESILAQSWWSCFRRLVFFTFLMGWTALWRKKVIWTVHDYYAHACRWPLFSKILYSVLYWRIDAFISLNQGSAHVIQGRFKRRSQRCYTLHHHHYRDYYPQSVSREEARRRFEVHDKQFVFLFLGLIRAYKNLPILCQSFEQLREQEGPNVRLIVAGDVRGDGKGGVKFLECTPGLTWYRGFVPEDQLQWFFAASDLVVTPYSRISNSGSLLLNLSFNRPTLGPEGGVFSEMQQRLGCAWIKTYNGELSVGALKRAMNEVIANASTQPVDLSAMDVDNVAQQTLQVYQAALRS